MKIDYKKLEKKIDIRFRDKNLLIKSLVFLVAGRIETTMSDNFKKDLIEFL